MTTLSGNDKRALKGRGQRLPDHCHLGKGGLTAEFAEHVSHLLDRHELIKLRFEDVNGAERRVLADSICEMVNAQCVSILGRTMLLFRENPEGSPEESPEAPIA